ncbi:MAG: acyl-CoA dehydrogenase family protein [Pseudomonadales bacterium]|jgi:acyl-CoA dehydrogenase|nr:acyl-CoA dehydrogenase family protein [Pseudomonadales bacterium]MBL6808579.1 acyl-CoA dehydrogenase family protein [Pseudomonadales bacterium]
MPLDPSTLEQLQMTVRRFVRERLVPLEAQVAREDRIPAEVIQEMRELGLFGLTVPESYGGLGLNTEEECKVVMELGWTSPAFRSVIGTNNGIGSQGLVMDGTEAQKDHWLPRMASGEVIGSFALTEPDAGSDAGSVRTRAERKGDGFVLNGRKRYITNAPHAQLFTVFARTDPDAPGSRGVSAFLVPADSKGLSLGKPEKKMGQQGAHVCDVIFEDVEVPAEALLGGEPALHKGFLTAMKTLDRGRLHISALAVGCAERLIDEATRYAAERNQFGQAIGEFQLVQAMLADSATEAYAAKTMVLDAARQRDAGTDREALASRSKLFATEMVGRVADRAVQIFGGAGYIEEYGIERFYRDVRLFRLYEGTSQIQQLIIAKALLKNIK